MGPLNIDSLQALDPVDFEDLVKVLLNRMGFNATTTKASGDGGIDLIAVNEKPIIGGKYIIQCKRYAIGNNVGEAIIRELYGVMHAENANKGILITTSDFSKQAINFSQDKAIELLNGYSLLSLLKQYFEEFSDNASSVELDDDQQQIGDLKNEPDNFRGVLLGSQLDTLKDMIFLENHWMGGSVCYRISDSKKLGSAIIESPRYIFDERGRFYLVNIEFQGQGNYESALSYLYKNYGKPYDFGNFTHSWLGEHLNIHLKYTPEQSDGQVAFIYKPIYDEVNEELQKLDARGFDELRLGFRGIKWGSKLEDLNGLVCNADLSTVTNKTCVKTADKKIFAGAIVFLNYYFFKEQFYAVGIDFQDRNNFETISDYLKRHYGEPYDINSSYDKPHFKWRNNEFEIFVYYIDEDNRGYIGFDYLPIKRESDAEWQNKNVPVQQQTKQCFVASVIYESPVAIEVEALRQWRDNYLSKHLYGRVLIKLYYRIGPAIAAYTKRRRLVKRIFKIIFNYFIYLLRKWRYI